MSAVKALLENLSQGKIPLEQVAFDFRKRDWPAPDAVTPKSYWEAMQAASSDPPEHVPDSFSEVSAAFAGGTISRAQYTTLARAAGDRIKEQYGESSSTS